MEQYLSLLTACPLFHGLTEEFITAHLLPYARTADFPRGAIILHPQQVLSEFGIILSGNVHICHISTDGDQRIMDSLEPGELYGASLMCTRSRISPHHALAAQACRILFFPITMLLAPGAIAEPQRSGIMTQLLTIIAHENMRKDYRLAILSQKGIRERLMTYLTMQAAKRGTATFTIPFDREALASFLCVNRSALSHEITLMKQEGLIRCRKNTFTLARWEEPEPHMYQ